MQLLSLWLYVECESNEVLFCCKLICSWGNCTSTSVTQSCTSANKPLFFCKINWCSTFDCNSLIPIFNHRIFSLKSFKVYLFTQRHIKLWKSINISATIFVLLFLVRTSIFLQFVTPLTDMHCCAASKSHSPTEGGTKLSQHCISHRADFSKDVEK